MIYTSLDDLGSSRAWLLCSTSTEFQSPSWSAWIRLEIRFGFAGLMPVLGFSVCSAKSLHNTTHFPTANDTRVPTGIWCFLSPQSRTISSMLNEVAGSQLFLWTALPAQLTKYWIVTLPLGRCIGRTPVHPQAHSCRYHHSPRSGWAISHQLGWITQSIFCRNLRRLFTRKEERENQPSMKYCILVRVWIGKK